MLKRLALISFFLLGLCLTVFAQRWTEQQAKDWYARQPWLVGANYIAN